MKAFLFVLFTLALPAQEMAFLEKFATPTTRKEALQKLTPLTRDWFYYHALEQQLRGDDVAFYATMREWQQYVENPKFRIMNTGFSVLENRQLLLGAKSDPDATAAKLSQKLDFTFDYEKSSVAESRVEPSKLDPQQISASAFEAEARKRTPDEPWRHYTTERLTAELKNLKNLSDEKCLALLRLLPTTASADALELIALCLEKYPFAGFGSETIHQSLTHEQLKTLLNRIPSLALSQKFSLRYLQTLRPSDERNYLRDPLRYLAHLQTCDDYLRNLPPTFDPWKADCLWQKLLLQRKINQLSREDLLRFLSLPLQNCSLLREPKNVAPGMQTMFGQSHFDVIGGNLSGNQDDLESMLIHFLRETKDLGDFEKYLLEDAAKKLHAKAHLLKGDEDNQWAAAFSAEELKELRQEAQLTFAAQQKNQFSAKDDVVLLLDCKNTPSISLRIFELDLVRYLRHHSDDPDATIELDGLVPHVERTLSFAQAPIIQHRESIAVPELKGRGAWVIECVSGGIASRALIRKGDLIPYIEQTSAGQLIRLFDESQQPIRSFRVHTSRETLVSQEDGTLLIPYTDAVSVSQKAVIEVTPGTSQGATLAKHVTLGSTLATYQFFCGFHIDREQLIADQTSRIFLQPRLLIHGQPCALDAIKNGSITITAELLSGATSDHVISLQKWQSVMTADFTMPRDATSLKIKVDAEIPREQNVSPIRLHANHVYQFNQSLATDTIYSSFFVQTTEGHRVEILGRNGEPWSERTIPLIFTHREFKLPLRIMMQTSKEGVIELGPLKDIEMVKLDVTSISTEPYAPHSLERITLPQVIHTSADQVIRIPLAKNTKRSGMSLVETTMVTSPKSADQALPTRDHTALLSIEEDQLIIKNIPAGNFLLTIDQTTIPVRISPAKPNSSLLVSPQRILQPTLPSTLQISATDVNRETIKIRLKQPSAQARVSVVASQFSATPSLSESWDMLPTILPAYTILGYHESSFLNNRGLDEEMRYVLDRRGNKIFPGNMLPRPGRLVHRVHFDSDDGNYDPAGFEKKGSSSIGSAFGSARGSSVNNKKIDSAHNSPLYDFLVHGSAVFYDLQPDANGVVTIERNKMPDARFLTICAADGNHYHQTVVPLEQIPLKKRERQLQRAFDPSKHYIGTQRAVILAKDQSEVINNMLDARWKEYATLDDVFRFFVSSSNNSLYTLSFLPKWNTLAEAEKIQRYQLHACHELHLFLARKDRKFFDQFVKPNLVQKRELTFMDHYLLEHDLSEYLNQKEWFKLNAAERALLCRAMPAAAARIRKEMQYEMLKFPIPLNVQAMHFSKALEGSQLSLSERAELASLGLLHEQERLAEEQALMNHLKSIIIPSVNLEDVTIAEAISFLQGYSPQYTLECEERFLSNLATVRIREMKLTNVPFVEALRQICELIRMKYSIQRNVIAIRPSSDMSEDMVVRVFQVPPDFVAAFSSGSENDEKKDPISIQHLLEQRGVPFPYRASASYDPASSTLLVRNTPSNIELIEEITQSLKASESPKAWTPLSGNGLALEENSLAYNGSEDPFMDAPASDAFALGESLDSKVKVAEQSKASLDHTTTTRAYQESQYWQYRNHSMNNPATMITINRFWLDLAQWDGTGEFLSTHFNECMKNDNEMLMALAVLDLPFTKVPSETALTNDALSLKAKQPLLLFYRDTRQTNNIIENSPILVRQTFYPASQRYQEVNGRQIENTIIGGKFSPSTAYGSALIIANPTGETRQVQVLWQIPSGSLPLMGRPATDSVTLELPPYSNEQINYSFYFPALGEFTCYPFHVSENDTILAYPQVTTMRVTDEFTSTDEDYFYDLADDGDEEKLLDFLRTKSLFDDHTDLYEILWRLKDRAFYDQVMAILNDRLHFHAEVFSFAFYHRDQANIRRYLENSSTIHAVGPWLDSPFLKVTSARDLHWFDQEFDPFINSRAHRLGSQDQLPLDLAKAHYTQFLNILCHKNDLSADDHLQLCYFLFLQNRIAEALESFAKIDRAKLLQYLHYDYMHCYILFYQQKTAAAKAIALTYEKHPLGIWRQRFQSVIAQADEIAKPVVANAEMEKKPSIGSYLTMAHKENGKILLTHEGLRQAEVHLYQVDMELLFTANPFLEQSKVLHHAIRPNMILNVKLSGNETAITLPPDYAKGNVIAAVESANTQILQNINSGKFAMKTNKALGEIQLVEQASSKVMPQTYVKVYACMDDDSVQFFKDGYTDLRGKFNYRDHNNIDPTHVKAFALLLSHSTLGTRIERLERNGN